METFNLLVAVLGCEGMETNQAKAPMGPSSCSDMMNRRGRYGITQMEALPGVFPRPPTEVGDARLSKPCRDTSPPSAIEWRGFLALSEAAKAAELRRVGGSV